LGSNKKGEKLNFKFGVIKNDDYTFESPERKQTSSSIEDGNGNEDPNL
jgi:hypothetical protein